MPPRKALRCIVEINVHSVTSPGTWLAQREDVYLVVQLFGKVRRTRPVEPVFPARFHDTLKFDKVFTSVLDPVKIAASLADFRLRVELLQAAPKFGEDRVLAWYESSAKNFLYPYPSHSTTYGTHDRDVVLERSLAFPGISPRLEFSTKTNIEETSTPHISLFDDNESLSDEATRYSRSARESKSKFGCTRCSDNCHCYSGSREPVPYSYATASSRSSRYPYHPSTPSDLDLDDNGYETGSSYRKYRKNGPGLASYRPTMVGPLTSYHKVGGGTTYDSDSHYNKNGSGYRRTYEYGQGSGAERRPRSMLRSRSFSGLDDCTCPTGPRSARVRFSSRSPSPTHSLHSDFDDLHFSDSGYRVTTYGDKHIRQPFVLRKAQGHLIERFPSPLERQLWSPDKGGRKSARSRRDLGTGSHHRYVDRTHSPITDYNTYKYRQFTPSNQMNDHGAFPRKRSSGRQQHRWTDVYGPHSGVIADRPRSASPHRYEANTVGYHTDCHHSPGTVEWMGGGDDWATRNRRKLVKLGLLNKPRPGEQTVFVRA